MSSPDGAIPGQPLIPLDFNSVHTFLSQELSTKRLDDMYSRLWLISSKGNISPLHHQAIKGRQILITESPDLHLVWYYDQIFIKPIPRCLLNYAFFKTFVSRDESVRLATNGFLRTYAKLIVHESDFEVAKEKKLLPCDEITWKEWCKFIQGFRDFDDAEVTLRYQYGELRLTRLNFYSKVFFDSWNYFDTYTQYGWYFKQFIAPYLFVFGSITVVLTAMQTAITADSESVYKNSAYGFSTFSIGTTLIGLALFPVLYLLFQLREFVYALLHQKG
ncbi:hypothetical protein K440DRAFT_650199 [Wilcoxina mikolae CBS 423.85]|nr:hypothetical protein K440DRAFT_650199 [Wilcoxina mikolae CBS 423.85]